MIPILRNGFTQMGVDDLQELEGARIQKEWQQTQRFIQVLNHAMIDGNHSQRGLCAQIGIKVGTLTKYLRGEVAPLRTQVGIQRLLAKELGVTLDALIAYYETGKYATKVSLDAVESWIRSEAGQQTMPVLMEALQVAGKRWLGEPAGSQLALPAAPEPEPEPEPPPLYDWPLKEVQSAELSDKMLQRLGLTAEVLERLATTGEYDDDLVEGFAVACNYEEDAVREAFASRSPIA